VYYYYQAAWSDKPVLHLFPHWNWAGKEGQPIDVWVFGNCDSVRLELNGEVIDKKPLPKLGHIEWKVPYKAGVLVARGYNADGKQIVVDKVETTGAPASVKITPSRAKLLADGDDVALVTVEVMDNQGLPVPTADNLVSFSITGPGKIVGIGNGDPISHEPDKFADGATWQRKLFNGLAQIIVQSKKDEQGKILLSASANGLESAQVEIKTHLP